MKVKNPPRSRKAILVAIIIATSLAIGLIFGHRFPATLDSKRAIIDASNFFHDVEKGDIPMRKPYIGINLYITVLMPLTGYTKEALLWLQTLFITLAAVTTFLIAERLSGGRTGLISSIVLLSLPVFSMVRWNEEPFLAFHFMLAFLCLYNFHRTQRGLFLCSGMLLSGLAIYMNFISLYFFASMAAAYTVLIKLGKVRRAQIKMDQIALGMVFLLIGLSPLIWHNLREGWPAIRFTSEAAGSRAAYVLPNIATRLVQLFMAVQGVVPSYPLENLFVVFVPLGAAVLLASLALGMIKKHPVDLFLAMTLVFFAIFSSFVPPPSAPTVIHLYCVLPLAAILIARFFSFVKRLRTWVFVPLLIAFLSLNLLTMSVAVSRLSDERWIEDNWPRVARVHSDIVNFLKPRDVVILPWIEILGTNIKYYILNGHDFSMEVVCEEYAAPEDRAKARCDEGSIKEVIERNAGRRLVFASAPLERENFSIYEQNCETRESICSAPLRYVRKAVEDLGMGFEKIGSIMDSRENEAYVVYLIKGHASMESDIL